MKDVTPASRPAVYQSPARAAFKVTAGSAFCLLAGLGNQVVVAALFGAGLAMDAFLTASVVPDYACAVLVTALTFAFLPVLVHEQVASTEEGMRSLIATILRSVAIGSTALAVVGLLLTDQVIALVAPGLSPDKAALSVAMLRPLILTLPLTGLYGIAVTVHNAHDRFFLPAIAPAFGSLANLLIVLCFRERVGPLALAWGALGSAGLQAVIVLVPLWRYGGARALSWRDRRLAEVARLAAPFLIFGVLTRATPVLERYFASGLPHGELSYLGYAAKVGGIVQSLLVVGIATSIYPTMARRFEKQGRRGLAETAVYGLQLAAAVGIPALVLLSVGAAPVVGLLYERGSFDQEVTLRISRVLPLATATVVGQLFLNVINRVFYVQKQPWWAQSVAAGGALAYVGLAGVLAPRAGYVGLAWAQALQVAGTCGVMLLLLIWQLGSSFHLRSLARLAVPLLCAAASGLVSWTLLRAIGWMPPLGQAVFALLPGGVVYLASLACLDRSAAVIVAETLGLAQLWQFLSPVLKRLSWATPRG